MLLYQVLGSTRAQRLLPFVVFGVFSAPIAAQPRKRGMSTRDLVAEEKRSAQGERGQQRVSP